MKKMRNLAEEQKENVACHSVEIGLSQFGLKSILYCIICHEYSGWLLKQPKKLALAKKLRKSYCILKLNFQDSTCKKNFRHRAVHLRGAV